METTFITNAIKKLNNKKINYFTKDEMLKELEKITDAQYAKEYLNYMKNFKFKIKIEGETYLSGIMTSYNRWSQGEKRNERDVYIDYDNDGYFHISGVYTSFDWYGKVNADGTISKQ